MKAQSRLFVVTLVCVITRETVATSSVKSLNGSVTWSQAREECSKYGHGFTLLSFNSTQSGIEREMTENGHEEVWLNLKRKQLDTWEWVDGQPVDGGFAQGNWKETQNCGKFHLRDRTLEADECSKKNYGIICRYEGNCTSFNGSRADCLDNGNTSLIFVGHADNWYDARYRCFEGNLTLAIVQNEALMDRLYQQWYLKDRKHPTELWVGLRRQEWLQNGNENVNVFKSYWAPGEPSQKGNCSLLSRDSDGKLIWNTTTCSARHNAVCHRANRKEISGSMDPTRKEPDIQQTYFMWIIIGISIGGAVGLAVIVILVFVLRRKKARRQGHDTFDETHEMKLLQRHEHEGSDQQDGCKSGESAEVSSQLVHDKSTENGAVQEATPRSEPSSLNEQISQSVNADKDKVNPQSETSQADNMNKSHVQPVTGNKDDPTKNKDKRSPGGGGLLDGYVQFRPDDDKSEYSSGPAHEIRISKLDVTFNIPRGAIDGPSKSREIKIEGYFNESNKKMPIVVKVVAKEGPFNKDVELRIPCDNPSSDSVRVAKSGKAGWKIPSTLDIKTTVQKKYVIIRIKTFSEYRFFTVTNVVA